MAPSTEETDEQIDTLDRALFSLPEAGASFEEVLLLADRLRAADRLGRDEIRILYLSLAEDIGPSGRQRIEEG